jgi:hypothetical protein
LIDGPYAWFMALDRLRSRCLSRLELLADWALDIDALRPDTLIPNRALVSDVAPWGSGLPHRWVLDQSIKDTTAA